VLETQDQPSILQTHVPPQEFRGIESLIDEFDGIEREANNGANPSAVNYKLREWSQRAKEALR